MLIQALGLTQATHQLEIPQEKAKGQSEWIDLIGWYTMKSQGGRIDLLLPPPCEAAFCTSWTEGSFVLLMGLFGSNYYCRPWKRLFCQYVVFIGGGGAARAESTHSHYCSAYGTTNTKPAKITWPSPADLTVQCTLLMSLKTSLSHDLHLNSVLPCISEPN